MSTFDLTAPQTWGPGAYNVQLAINEYFAEQETPVVIDVEDDEEGGFVGIGLYSGGDTVNYFTQIDGHVKGVLESVDLIGHNVKSDFHKLRSWGVNVKSSRLAFDTMLASNVIDPTKESHGLKELAADYFGIEYPAYKTLTGKGKNRSTLADLPVEVVANYNGMDCVATYRLYRKFSDLFTQSQREYFAELEMPINRLLFDMETRGIKVDKDYLAALDVRFGLEYHRLYTSLQRSCGNDFNPNSPKQVAERLLKGIGVNETKTGKEVLQRLESIPLVKTLTRFREVAKLRGTYTTPLSELAAQDPDARIHTTFNQITLKADGTWKPIRTGRLSSKDPNLQNIPDRTETGNLLRKSFVAEEGKVFVCADYGQIEPRLMAHYSQDLKMLELFRNGVDIYEYASKMTQKPRKICKTFHMARSYGAGVSKVAYILGISDSDAYDLDRAYLNVYPGFFAWKQELEYKATKDGGINTLLGGWRPLGQDDAFLAVATLIQGSAADVIKKAMLDLNNVGYFPILQVHDELLFELSTDAAHAAGQSIQRLMENTVKLAVPLVVEPGYGKTWAEAKG